MLLIIINTISLLEFPDLDLQCYAYASPCVLDLQLANQCRNYVCSYVLENDVVPRLSYGSMEYLKECTILLMGQSTSNFHRLVQALASRGTNSENISKKVAGILKYDSHVLDTKVLDENKAIFEDKLFPPGFVYHIMKDDIEVKDNKNINPKVKNPSLYRMEFSDAAGFAEIVVSPTMFSDHMPNAYNKALEGVIRHQSLVRHGLINLPEHAQYGIYASNNK